MTLTTWNRRIFSTLAVALAVASSWQAAQAQSVNNRKTTATATITGSHNLYDGSFASSLTSSVCGELPAEMNFSGLASFIVEFPSDGTGDEPIRSISFASNKLVGGVTTASVFRLNIGVTLPSGSKPFDYVLNTDSGKPGNSGIATLTRKGTATTLTVKGTNDMGETIDLTVVCM